MTRRARVYWPGSRALKLKPSVLSEADVVEPEAARGGVVGVDGGGNPVGGGFEGGGHADPAAVAGKDQVDLGDVVAVRIPLHQGEHAARAAGTAESAEAVGLPDGHRDLLAGGLIRAGGH